MSIEEPYDEAFWQRMSRHLSILIYEVIDASNRVFRNLEKGHLKHGEETYLPHTAVAPEILKNAAEEVAFAEDINYPWQSGIMLAYLIAQSKFMTDPDTEEYISQFEKTLPLIRSRMEVNGHFNQAGRLQAVLEDVISYEPPKVREEFRQGLKALLQTPQFVANKPLQPFL